MSHFLSFRIVRLAFLIMLLAALHAFAQAQTYTVLYNFTNQVDGGFPQTGVTIDQAGNLYGTTAQGGANNGGTVFKLSLKNSSWIFALLHTFAEGDDGFQPDARVTLGPDGSLYGTTSAGGGTLGCGCCGCGTVFNLRPPASVCRAAMCPWTETVLHRFKGSPTDGYDPASEVTFDHAGNLYGTTFFGGYGGGSVYQMSPGTNGWSEKIIYNFDNRNGGAYGPTAGVVVDGAGNLYGTASANNGAVFELTPSAAGWSETNILTFGNGPFGSTPNAGVTLDNAGNLYGATTTRGLGDGDGGVIFQLAPSGGNWIPSTVYDFAGDMNPNCANGPYSSLLVDRAGNLYGTNCGEYSVFKLTPTNGGWTYTSLHSFSFGDKPLGGVVMDANGNLYGTTTAGGAFGAGVVWEITP